MAECERIVRFPALISRVAPGVGASEGGEGGVAGPLGVDGRVSPSNSKAFHNAPSPRNLRKQKWEITPVY